MTIHFPTRASSRLNGALALIESAQAADVAHIEMARACERAARELSKAAGDFRRAARQEKKAGAAGAAQHTRK